MAKITANEKLQQFLVMALADESPKGTAVPGYLYTETPDNQESVLLQGAKLFHAGKISCLLLIDNQGGSEPGYPGAPPWQNRLRELGVPEGNILLIPFFEPLLHTLSESIAMARFASAKGWGEIACIAPPFHLPRCFISSITAIRHLGTPLCAYAVTGITQPWHEHAGHSQKVVHGLRRDLIVGELRRIRRYQQTSALIRLMSEVPAFLKGFLRNPLQELKKIPTYFKNGSPIPLISTSNALAYLERRDRL